MQVQNFECQIAAGQIGRYLAGDSLSGETLRQLEAHISHCSDCKAHLNERRAALVAMLDVPNQAVVSAPIDNPQKARPKLDAPRLAASLLKAFAKKGRAPSETGGSQPTSLFKPFAYSLALGGVLVGMTFVNRNPTAPLGVKVVDAIPSARPIPGSVPAPAAPVPFHEYRLIDVSDNSVVSASSPAVQKTNARWESPMLTMDFAAPPEALQPEALAEIHASVHPKISHLPSLKPAAFTPPAAASKARVAKQPVEAKPSPPVAHQKRTHASNNSGKHVRSETNHGNLHHRHSAAPAPEHRQRTTQVHHAAKQHTHTAKRSNKPYGIRLYDPNGKPVK